MDKRTEADGTEVWTNRRGELRVRTPARGLVVSRFQGDLSLEHADILAIATLRTADSVRRYAAFCDWEQMHNYETAARVRLTNLMLSLRARSNGTHLLVRSRVVALGVQVANALTGGLTSYSDRAAFELALARAIAAPPVELR